MKLSLPIKSALGGAALGATGLVFYSLLNTFCPSVCMESPAAVKFYLLGAVIVFAFTGAVVGRAREEDCKKKKEIIQRNHELSALNSISSIISKNNDRDKMLEEVLSEVINLHFLEVMKKGAVFLVEDGGDGLFLRMTASLNLDPALTEEEDCIPLGHCLCGKAAKEGRCIISLNCMKDPGHTTRYDGMKPHGHIIIPIKSEGAVLGVMNFYMPPDVSPSIADVRLLKGMARQLSVALKNQRLIGDLKNLSLNIISALSSAIDAKSSWTKGHSERVSEYAAAIGDRLGMDQRSIERMRLAGLLHDIGKIGTYDQLLDKTGKLTPEEQELIKRHPDKGCEILAPIEELADILPAVRHHHERWDGGGYPAGLKGTEIPLMARVLSVADSFDTMTYDRPYRPSIGIDNAIQELKYCSGSQFDPEIVEIFLELCCSKGILACVKD
ncbi:MAG: HD domain-containing phosphohydrolase [Nitrospirota bacterium]